MPISQIGLILYLMLALTIWILGPVFLIVSLLVIFKKPTSRRMWIRWCILAVLNIPGITIGGGWLLMMSVPFFEGKSMFLIAPIVYACVGVPFVLFYKLNRKETKKDNNRLQDISA